MKSRSDTNERGHAEVITWGTEFEGGNGLRYQLAAKFKGGNIGHAAIRLTIPIDDSENADELIKKYCYEDNRIVLPHTKRELPNGKEVFEVYISAWSNDTVTLERDYIMDSLDEREGVHFNWDQKFQEQFKPSKRSYKGLYDRTTMLLGPEEVIHRRNMSDEQYNRLTAIQRFKSYAREVDNFELLERRIPRISTLKTLNATELILLDRLIPDWRSNVKKPPKLSDVELSNLISQVSISKNKYETSEASKTILNDVSNLAKNELVEIQNQINADFKKWQKISPKTAERIMENRKLIGQPYGMDDVQHFTTLTSYTGTQISELLEYMDSKIKKGWEPKELISHYKGYIPSNTQLLETSYTFGLPPDHIVRIPLDSISSPSNDGSLKLEPMLRRAKEIATSNEKFSLTGTNCSKVAGLVLFEGAQGNKKRKIFNREAMNKFATPQLVLNNSLNYLRNLSKQSKKKYNQAVDIKLKDQPKQDVSQYVPGFKEITFDGIDQNLTPKEKCAVFMGKFEGIIKNGSEIPYFDVALKLKIESIIKDDSVLETRFAELCQAAIIKANKQSIEAQTLRKDEWGIVNSMIDGTAPQQKISKKDNPELSYSYIILDINGQKKPFRVSHDVLGKGMEGKVKIIENQQGERFAVKILANTASLDTEVANMKEVGAVITDFTRKREKKYSKTLQDMIGDKRYVVMPLHKGTEIAQLLRNKNLTDNQKIELALKCCEAIKKLHDQGILHRDIKSANFIASIDDSSGKIEEVNVIDFGGSIKTNEKGEVIAHPFGTPGFIAPEVGGVRILQISREVDKQQQIAKKHGLLVIEASDQINLLNKKMSELKSEQSVYKEQLFQIFPDKSTIFNLKDKDEVVKILSNYNGKNLEEIQDRILALSKTGASYKKDIVISSVKSYCVLADNTKLVANEIALYQEKINKSSQARELAEKNASIERAKLDAEFGKDVKQTSASDIYSLGIMFNKMFGLKLEDLGLAEMLNTDPEKRPNVDSIIKSINNKLGIPESQKEDNKSRVIEIKDNIALAERLPRNVDPTELHKANDGKLCVFSSDEMSKLNEMRSGKTNQRLTINDSTVFLTKEGGAFILHSPISSGAIGSTYLVQNLDDYSWSVMKMVKGKPHEIRGQLSQFQTENKTLNSLNQLNGTLQLTAGTQNMHISIQPYVHGKTYTDVMKEAHLDENGLSVHSALLMSLKAFESLTDLHENHGILHRDIKPENMMWDVVTNKASLIDFGCAGKRGGQNLEIADVSKRGTAKYQAPEIDFEVMMKRDRKYSEKTDIYSMGIIVGELLSIIKNSENDPSYQQLKQLQASLTNPDPVSRPKAKEAVEKISAIIQSMANTQSNQVTNMAKVSQMLPGQEVESPKDESNVTTHTGEVVKSESSNKVTESKEVKVARGEYNALVRSYQEKVEQYRTEYNTRSSSNAGFKYDKTNARNLLNVKYIELAIARKNLLILKGQFEINEDKKNEILKQIAILETKIELKQEQVEIYEKRLNKSSTSVIETTHDKPQSSTITPKQTLQQPLNYGKINSSTSSAIQVPDTSKSRYHHVDWQRFDHIINAAIKDCIILQENSRKVGETALFIEITEKLGMLEKIKSEPKNETNKDLGMQLANDVLKIKQAQDQKLTNTISASIKECKALEQSSDPDIAKKASIDERELEKLKVTPNNLNATEKMQKIVDDIDEMAKSSSQTPKVQTEFSKK